MRKCIWPKSIWLYLIMPISFPLWVIGRVMNPKFMNTYFLDQKEEEEEEEEGSNDRR